MIYEYRCNECQKVQEFWMKMSDPHPTACKNCASPSLERIISNTSFALKGSGWYTTDYKRSSSPAGKSSNTQTSGPDSSSGAACNGAGPGACGGPCSQTN